MGGVAKLKQVGKMEEAELDMLRVHVFPSLLEENAVASPKFASHAAQLAMAALAATQHLKDFEEILLFFKLISFCKYQMNILISIDITIKMDCTTIQKDIQILLYILQPFGF